MKPDYRIFYGSTHLIHSSGDWKNHKYIKRVDGTYYYPKGYKNGRTIDELKGQEDKPEEEAYENLSDEDVENLVKEVIQGKFGNGDVRKEALGENYQRIQDKVNELLKSQKLSKKKDSKSSNNDNKTNDKIKKHGNFSWST